MLTFFFKPILIFLVFGSANHFILYFLVLKVLPFFFFFQLQSGLEANRILLRSVSPRLSIRQAKEKKPDSEVTRFARMV